MGDDLVEGQRRRVDQARARRRRGEDVARHQRAGIEADRAALDQPQAAHGDQIGGAGTGADEMDGHCAGAVEIAARRVKVGGVAGDRRVRLLPTIAMLNMSRSAAASSDSAEDMSRFAGAAEIACDKDRRLRRAMCSRIAAASARRAGRRAERGL